MPHVDDGRLHALLDGALRAEDPEGAAAVERHLAGCEDCRARLDDAAELREGARSILDAAAPAAVAPVPDFSEVQARAEATGVGQGRTASGTSRPGTRRRMATQAAWTRRAAWAASLVVALGTGYLLRDLADPPAPTAETRLSAPTAEADDGEAGARSSADLRPDAAADGTPRREASRSTEDGGMANRGGSGANVPDGAADGGADRQADGAAGAAIGTPATPIGDAAPPPRQPAADEETIVAPGRAEAMEERAADELVTAQRARQLSVTGAEPPSSLTAAPTPTPTPTTAPAVPAADPSRTPARAVAEAEAVETEAYRWSAVAVEEARRSLDGPVYLLPRAAILELYVSADTAAPRVMSRQRLESGVVVEVVQWRGEDQTPAGVVDPTAEKAAEPEAGDRLGLPAREVTRVVRGPFLLQVTGSLPEELLAILAESATPAR